MDVYDLMLSRANSRPALQFARRIAKEDYDAALSEYQAATDRLAEFDALHGEQIKEDARMESLTMKVFLLTMVVPVVAVILGSYGLLHVIGGSRVLILVIPLTIVMAVAGLAVLHFNGIRTNLLYSRQERAQELADAQDKKDRLEAVLAEIDTQLQQLTPNTPD